MRGITRSITPVFASSGGAKQALRRAGRFFVITALLLPSLTVGTRPALAEEINRVVLRVNEMSLDSPEKALQILQQLREARHLTVDLERRNKPMTFTYEIK